MYSMYIQISVGMPKCCLQIAGHFILVHWPEESSVSVVPDTKVDPNPVNKGDVCVVRAGGRRYKGIVKDVGKLGSIHLELVDESVCAQTALEMIIFLYILIGTEDKMKELAQNFEEESWHKEDNVRPKDSKAGTRSRKNGMCAQLNA